MRRSTLPWLGAFLIAVLFTTGCVVALNATAFGAGAFVRVYLDAVARGDAAGALSLPGVTSGNDSRLLLTPDALGGLSDIQQVSDVDVGSGHHRVTMDWTSPLGSGTSTFEVAPVGTRLGLFPRWGFAVSPLATVQLSVQHDPRFTVNGWATTTGLAIERPIPYAVLVPGGYAFAHSSPYLTAATQNVLVASPGQSVSTAVDVQANDDFAALVQSRIDADLDSCATQQVLFPAGCPFGQQIDNRVSSTPAWKIAGYPKVTIRPGSGYGHWRTLAATGAAHLTVSVTSLFDGSVSTFDQNVAFSISYSIVLTDSGIELTRAG